MDTVPLKVLGGRRMRTVLVDAGSNAMVPMGASTTGVQGRDVLSAGFAHVAGGGLRKMAADSASDSASDSLWLSCSGLS